MPSAWLSLYRGLAPCAAITQANLLVALQRMRHLYGLTPKTEA